MAKKTIPMIEELLSNKTWIDYFSNRNMEPYFGESLFPAKTIPTMKYEYIVGADDTPVTAHFHAFNTEAEIASRAGIQRAEAELGIIKRKIPLNEELIKKLAEPRNEDEFNDSIDTLFDDIEKLYKSVATRIEVARFDIIQSGQLNVKENGITMTLDFKMPKEHKVDSGIDWSQDADIIGDLTTWCDTISNDTGVRPTRAVTSTKVIQLITKNVGIRKAINGLNMDKAIRMSEVNELFVTGGLPKFISYDGKYKEEDKNGKLIDKRFLSEDRVVLFPPDNLGHTLFTPTPEHIVLKKDPTINQEKVGNILVMSWFESKDPICWLTKAVTCSMPSFPLVKKVFSAKVF